MPSSLSTAGSPSRLGLATITLLALLAWALSHRYLGIFHDAGLYTLQALAHLHPKALANDPFLALGSQDRFTVFSPLYAVLARLMGIEPAAAALTLLSQLTLMAAAWALARRIMPAGWALIGTASFIAVPGYYGAGHIFTCIEPFLTPRMSAEALVLGALAAWLAQRRILALGLVTLAALLHPIMALAGVAALGVLAAGLRYPAKTLCGMGLAAVPAIVALDALRGRFDPAWLALVRDRSPYLFLASWRLDDWACAAVAGVTLAAGLRRPATKTLCGMALATTAIGLTATFIGSDLLRLVLATQLQTWRWQWLATALAALLAPRILRDRWADGAAGRATALLLIAAWLFGGNGYALFAAAAAAAALTALHRLKTDEIRWVVWGSGGLVLIALVWRLASNLEFTEAYYLDPTVALWMRKAESFAHDGAAALALLAVAWNLARQPRTRPVLLLLCGLCAMGLGVILRPTWESWTRREFPPERVAQFTAMRDRIPTGSAVFWPESPQGVWLLLDRPSYLSVLQTSGLVFSRAAALDLERRAQALATAMDPRYFLRWDSASTALTLSIAQLEAACRTGSFPYLVSAATLSIEPVASVPAPRGPKSKRLNLYECRAYARAAAAAT